MTTETLMTEGQNTTAADQQQSAATTATEGQQAQGATDAATQQQATEGQNTEGQQAEGAQQTQEGQQAKAGAPEKYEFKAQEGQQFDDAVIGAFSEIAKELDLPQEAAQKVLDKMAPVIAARQTEQLQAARTEWAETAKADKEFGGDKLAENLAFAKKARDAFATPEFVKLLDDTGLGNHPEVIRVFYRAGKAISEDRIVTGGNSRPSNDARNFYPNSNMN